MALSADQQRLCDQIAYQFNQPELLQLALTHRSHSKQHNERLEFLGDSVLSYVTAEYLYQTFPSAQEGELSRLRASLVRGRTLAALAQSLDLGSFLLLGQGELKSGGYLRHSILEDAFEALIGALYLDGGMLAVKSFVFQQYQQRFAQLSLTENTRDAKSQLQEWLQGHGHSLPAYEIDRIEGPEHQQIFYVRCHITQLAMAILGQGSSRKNAEQAAALQALVTIKARHV